MKILLTTSEVAEMYGVTSNTITRNWLRRGLRSIRGKNSYMFRTEWVDEFLERISQPRIRKIR